ncbi:MAG: AraC family transcriptional regulator, partial [Clostridia bacterium]|nr:AraC family transcriptional regulator [Clostridia bacterium]
MNSSYIRTKFNNFINVTEIVTIHYYEFDNTFEFKGEKNNFWEIVYVDSGSVEIMCDDKKNILKQGEILFHQ